MVQQFRECSECGHILGQLHGSESVPMVTTFFRLTGTPRELSCSMWYTNKNTMVGTVKPSPRAHATPLQHVASHNHNNKISEDASSVRNSYPTFVNQPAFPCNNSRTTRGPSRKAPQSCTSGVCSVVIPWQCTGLRCPFRWMCALGPSTLRR